MDKCRLQQCHHFFSQRFFYLSWLSLFLLVLSQIFGQRIWQLELFSHFVPYYLLCLFLCVLIYPKRIFKLTSRTLKAIRWWFLGVAMCLLLWCLQNMNIFTTEKTQTSYQPVSIYYQNVQISNLNPSHTLNQLINNAYNNANDNQTKVLILLEAGGEDWQNALVKLSSQYLTHCGHDDISPFAMQVFISDNQATCEVVKWSDFPVIRIQLADGRLIYAVHPPPPINDELAIARQNYLQALTTEIHQHLSKASVPIMVVGDFNTTAFSPIFRALLQPHQSSNISLQKTNANILPTWLPLGLSIDHILMTNPQSTNVKTLAWAGSDHRGFAIEWW